MRGPKAANRHNQMARFLLFSKVARVKSDSRAGAMPRLISWPSFSIAAAFYNFSLRDQRYGFLLLGIKSLIYTILTGV